MSKGDSPYTFPETSNSDDYYPRAAAFHLYPGFVSSDASEGLARTEGKHSNIKLTGII